MDDLLSPFPYSFLSEFGRIFLVAQTFSLAFFTEMTVATKTDIKRRSNLKTCGRHNSAILCYLASINLSDNVILVNDSPVDMTFYERGKKF